MKIYSPCCKSNNKTIVDYIQFVFTPSGNHLYCTTYRVVHMVVFSSELLIRSRLRVFSFGFNGLVIYVLQPWSR